MAAPYKIPNSAQGILYLGGYVPPDPGSHQWQAYQTWLAAGGMPEAADPAPPPSSSGAPPAWAADGSVYGKTATILEGPANPQTSFQLFVGLTIPVTNSPISYERAAAYFNTVTQDVTKGTTITFDAVGVIAQGVIATGNLQGRAWGANFYGIVRSGADGLSAGVEIDLVNGGSNQPALYTSTSKYGQLIVVQEGLGTSACHVQGAGTGQWQNCFSVDPQFIAPGGTAFTVLGKISILADGSINMNGGVISVVNGALQYKSPAGKVTILAGA